MQKKYFEMGKEDCENLAMEIFLKSSGLDRTGKKYDRMRADAFGMRNLINNEINLKSVYITFDKDEFKLTDDTLYMR